MAKSYSVTSAGVNPTEDRAHRMRMYFIAMALRVLCVISLFWVRGWWVLLVGAAAALLPWFAVMVGNAVAHDGGEAPDRPEPLQLEGGEAEAERPAAETLLVVDVEPERRARPAPGTNDSPADGTNDSPVPGTNDGPAPGTNDSPAPGTHEGPDEDAERRA